MNKKMKGFLALFLSLFLFTGCWEDGVDPENPRYKGASENFEVTTPFKVVALSPNGSPRSNYALSVGEQYFEAEFNESVSWSIKIVGSSSGAVKTISGTSQSINRSNSQWKGDADGVRFFSVNDDPVIITLEILGIGEIARNNSYDILNIYTYSDRYVLLNSMNESSSTSLYTYYDNDQTDYTTDDDENIIVQYASADGLEEPVYNIGIGNSYTVKFRPSRLNPGQVIEPLEGSGYLHVSGIDGNGSSSFFVGGFRTANASQPFSQSNFVNKGWISPKPADSVYVNAENGDASAMTIVENYEKELKTLRQNLYVNVYVNSNGNRTTRVDVELREVISADDWNADNPDDQVVDDVEQDKLVKSINIDWEGWKLISVKMSDMNWHPVENSGNRIWDWEKFKTVGFGVLAGNEGAQGSPVEANFDFLTFSYGAPFKKSIN